MLASNNICSTKFEKFIDLVLSTVINCQETDSKETGSGSGKYEILLDNCYKVTIKLKYPNIYIIHIGYFNNDTVI